MNTQYVQNLRYKLQKRARRLNSVEPRLFGISLRQFWTFFHSYAAFVGVIDSLIARHPQTAKLADEIVHGHSDEIMHGGELKLGETEEEAAALGYFVLERCVASKQLDIAIEIGGKYCYRVGKHPNWLDTFREIFLEPFYEYVDESLDDQSAILMLLKRHKHRCEWFHRERLLKIAAEGGPSEKRLAMDMYEYLHDQGLDFSIEPWSISGEVDLIAAQESDDPLVLDAKVFDGENRSKNYLRKAFNQIYTYTRDYNQPVGYLVIFKTCKHDLKLVLKNSAQRTPFVLYNNKVIFLIVIDLYPYDKPASQRGPLKVVEVTEDDLVSVEGA